MYREQSMCQEFALARALQSQTQTLSSEEANMTTFEIAFSIVALLFFVGGIDDLLIDLVYWKNGLGPKKISKPEWQLWRSQDQKPIAVMIPAWQESAVLEAMVKTNLLRIRYKNYKWFIGVYPNDKATLDIAKALENKYPSKVVVVITDRPGPTSKAHCLNCILRVIRGMVELQKFEGRGWSPHYIAIHDAEDVIHPESFTAVNAQGADLDFIQLPIFSLPVPASEWISGTYLDEFAEIHLKEIPVRQLLKMPIPSAGVGTFFSTQILMKMGARFGYWFDEGNLTEDYEISWRIARLGGKQLFLLVTDEGQRIVATREYFPSELGRSIRQKTRWTTGIGLQTAAKWKNFGVFKSGFKLSEWLTAYAVFRDRKALWANPTLMGSWFLVIVLLSTGLMNIRPDIFQLKHYGLMTALIFINTGFFVLRSVSRALFCAEVYGVRQGILAVPRVLVSNYVNVVAGFKALIEYAKASQKQQQTQMVWDKTDHRFPDETVIKKAMFFGAILLTSLSIQASEASELKVRLVDRCTKQPSVVSTPNGLDLDIQLDEVAVTGFRVDVTYRLAGAVEEALAESSISQHYNYRVVDVTLPLPEDSKFEAIEKKVQGSHLWNVEVVVNQSKPSRVWSVNADFYRMEGRVAFYRAISETLCERETLAEIGSGYYFNRNQSVMTIDREIVLASYSGGRGGLALGGFGAEAAGSAGAIGVANVEVPLTGQGGFAGLWFFGESSEESSFRSEVSLQRRWLLQKGQGGFFANRESFFRVRAAKVEWTKRNRRSCGEWKRTAIGLLDVGGRVSEFYSVPHSLSGTPKAASEFIERLRPQLDNCSNRIHRNSNLSQYLVSKNEKQQMYFFPEEEMK